METNTELLRYKCAANYVRNGGVGFFQSFLKHSLIPVEMLRELIPESGAILDVGCGEGILANLLARFPETRSVTGVDLDEAKIDIARRNAAPNSRFLKGDAFMLPADIRADVAVFNDMLHHNPYSRHLELLSKTIERLSMNGLLVIKEVDQGDFFDRHLTTYFDRKLYPKDRLCYRSAPEWASLLKRLGINKVVIKRVRHPWPASRTIIIGYLADAKCRSHDRQQIQPADSRPGNETTNVLITGGTGFIGGHLAEYLLKHGLEGKKARILLLTRNPGNIPEALKNDRVIPLIGELDELPQLGRFLRNVEYVFHLAAEVKFNKGLDVWRHNYEGTLSLLKALAGSSLKRFIYASTIGAVDRAPDDACNRPLNEDDPPFPLSQYGKSKLMAEKAVSESGFDYSIIRVTWAYGPGMTPDTHIRSLMQGVHDGKLFSFFNFPGRVSVLAVSDLVRAFILIAEKNDAKNRIFFASDGSPVSLGELFKIMGEMTGRKPARINIPVIATKVLRKIRKFLPLTVQNLNSDVLCASNSRLSELGFKPVISKREGLKILAQSLGLCPYHFDEDKKLVSVITGAGSGIGRALTDLMILKGHHLLLVDKDEKKLLELSRLYNAEILCLDLTLPRSWEILREHIVSKKYLLDWVINNAGIGVRGPMAGIPFARQKMMIDLNCSAVTFVINLAITAFSRVGRGVLINIASSAAFQPLPGMSVYAATKAYILSLSRSICGEISDIAGIRVLTVSPSGTETNFQNTAGVKRDRKEKLLSPEFVAARMLDAVYGEKQELVIGLTGKAMSAAAHFMPIKTQIKLWKYLMRSKR